MYVSISEVMLTIDFNYVLELNHSYSDCNEEFRYYECMQITEVHTEC
jgi:hypothetical protein